MIVGVIRTQFTFNTMKKRFSELLFVSYFFVTFLPLLIPCFQCCLAFYKSRKYKFYLNFIKLDFVTSVLIWDSFLEAQDRKSSPILQERLFLKQVHLNT